MPLLASVSIAARAAPTAPSKNNTAGGGDEFPMLNVKTCESDVSALSYVHPHTIPKLVTK